MENINKFKVMYDRKFGNRKTFCSYIQYHIGLSKMSIISRKCWYGLPSGKDRLYERSEVGDLWLKASLTNIKMDLFKTF